MNKESPRFKYLMTTVINLFLFLSLLSQACAEVTPPSFFNQLQERLIADGFDAKRIRELYQSEEIFFETTGIAAYFQHNEAKLNYRDIITQHTRINEARNYMNQHAETLSAAEREFGVRPEVITAIILVETNLGRYLGRRSIINILSSMAVLSQPTPRKYLYERLNEKKRFDLGKYNVRADKKSRWAYKELKAFLTYTDLHEVDPLSVVGSYAGALGIAQFMPSNILIYGQDGNGDGRIDLFHDADAIFSIASYLKHFGWKPNINHDQAFKVIYHYNHSRQYVNTVLRINELLAS